MKKYLKLLAVPLVLLAFSFVISLAWQLFDLPEREQLIAIVKEWFRQYGIWVVFVSALIEGVLLFGNYYPGGLVIFLGVISAGGDVTLTVGVVFTVCVALFIAYYANYLLGKYGWYTILAKFGMREAIERTKQKLLKHQFSAIMGSYWFPNLASITSTSAGVLQLPVKKFLVHSAIGVLVWNSLWGTLVASLGDRALDIISFKWVLIIVGAWIAVVVIRRNIVARVSFRGDC